jgi:hypothetical protein
MSRKLDGPQSQTGDCEKEENLLPLLRTEPQFLACPDHSLVTILTMIYRIQIIVMLITKEEKVQK